MRHVGYELVLIIYFYFIRYVNETFLWVSSSQNAASSTPTANILRTYKEEENRWNLDIDDELYIGEENKWTLDINKSMLLFVAGYNAVFHRHP